MKYKISDEKLKSIIDELGEEYKDLLIERVLDDMNETDTDSISPSKLIHLDVKAKRYLEGNKKTQRQYRIFSLASIVGILYGMLGSVLLMNSETKLNVQDDTTMMMALVLMMLGISVATLSIAARGVIKIRRKHYKRTATTISPYEAVNKWKELEALIVQLTPESDSLSLSSMIVNLVNTNIISYEDTRIINRLLTSRNQIVHGKNRKYDLSQADLKELLVQVDGVISKLRKYA